MCIQVMTLIDVNESLPYIYVYRYISEMFDVLCCSYFFYCDYQNEFLLFCFVLHCCGRAFCL